MVRASFTVLGCRAQAEECAADVAAELLACPPESVQNSEAFLVTVAKRRAIDRYRSELSARRRLDRYAVGDVLVSPDIADSVAERDAAAWADAQARALLTPRGYAALRMVADGVPVAEIARALGVSERAAEGHLRRARLIMRSALAKALAAIGLVVAGLRRGFGASAPATAALATVALLMVLPVTGSPDGEPRIEVPKAESSVLPAHPAQRRASEGRPEPASTPGKVVQAPRLPAPKAEVQTPLVGLGTYDKDDGYEADGPLDLIAHCVENLRVERHYAGCDEPPP